MNIEPFCAGDIGNFLMLAAGESWVAESWEFEFLLAAFPQGCFVAHDDNGKTAGYVTSLRHERSGWIGNLIVAPESRGKGIGEALFKQVLETLQGSGVETVWLTASKAGMSLYKKFGFSRIDTIIRWNGNGRQRHTGHNAEEAYANTNSLVNDIDRQTWDDRRAELLVITTGRGKVLQLGSGFIVVQPCGDDVQLGPFSAHGYVTAETLLKTALNTILQETKVSLDAPASNRTAQLLFSRNEMRIAGSNELMYAGVKPDYRPELLYGLATMGSCG